MKVYVVQEPNSNEIIRIFATEELARKYVDNNYDCLNFREVSVQSNDFTILAYENYYYSITKKQKESEEYGCIVSFYNDLDDNLNQVPGEYVMVENDITKCKTREIRFVIRLKSGSDPMRNLIISEEVSALLREKIKKGEPTEIGVRVPINEIMNLPR